MTDMTIQRAFDELRDQVHLVLAHLLTDGAMDCPPVTDEKRRALADVTQTHLDTLLTALDAATAKLAAAERVVEAVREQTKPQPWLTPKGYEATVSASDRHLYSLVLDYDAATQPDGGDA